MSFGLGLIWIAIATGSGADEAPDELERYLAAQEARLDDEARPMAERAQIVAEMAAALVRASDHAATSGEARGRLGRAAQLIEGFVEAHAGWPSAAELTLRAARLRLDVARSWLQQSEQVPADSSARARAREAYKDVTRRLRPLAQQEQGPIRDRVAINLADALIALSDLDAADDAALAEAETCLREVTRTNHASGEAHRLHAELHLRRGCLEQAEQSLQAAERAELAASPEDLLRTRVRILTAGRRWSEADAALERWPGPSATALLLRLSVTLDRYTQGQNHAQDRAAALTEALARRLRAAGGSEGLGRPAGPDARSAPV